MSNMAEKADAASDCTEMSDPHQLPSKPVVTVYMAAYNHAPYIAQAIEGVLAQETDFPIELLIGEDCSTDDTRVIVVEYQRRRPEIIRVVTGPDNIGGRRNFQRTVPFARGEFIAFCEGDDWWCTTNKLKEQYALISSDPGLAAVHTDFAMAANSRGKWIVHALEGAHRRYHSASADLSGDIFPRVFSRFTIKTCTVMYRRQAIEEFFSSEFNSAAYRAGDAALAAFSSVRWRFGYIDKVHAVYRLSPNSAVRSGFKSMTSFLVSLRSLYQHFKTEYGHLPHFDDEFESALLEQLVCAAFRANDKEVFADALNALDAVNSPASHRIDVRFRAFMMRVPGAPQTLEKLLTMRSRFSDQRKLRYGRS